MQARFMMVATVLLSVCFASVRAAEAADEAQGSFWMQKKMTYAEGILAGLATENFEAIAKNARSMKALNQMEKWVRSSVPEYRTQLKAFENAEEHLVRAADNENLDAAAMAYFQLTLSCINCHKAVRDIQRADKQSK